MRITVCFQVVPDLGMVPENKLPVTPEETIQGVYPRVIDTYDESALEQALRLKDQDPSIELCAVTISENDDQRIYQSLFALGFSEVKRIDAAIRPFESKRKAVLLAAEGEKSDFILTGRQSCLAGTQLTPRYLAEILEIPYVDNVCELVMNQKGLRFKAAGGGECIDGTLTASAVLMVGDGGWLRIPTLKAKMAAKKINHQIIEGVAVETEEVLPVALHHPPGKTECRWITGTPAEQAGAIRRLIIETKSKMKESAAEKKNIRKTYGGALMAEYTSADPVRPSMTQPDKSWICELSITKDTSSAGLKKAETVFLAGRGVGSEANREKLAVSAENLGAAVGATRSAVLAGWYPIGLQIGISGLNLTSRVVVLFGVSGAAALTAGLESCDLIIAVNKDPEAPIFKGADYGIVADCSAILNEMNMI